MREIIVASIIVSAGMTVLASCASASQTEIDFGQTCGKNLSVKRYIAAGSYQVDIYGEGVKGEQLGRIPGNLIVTLQSINTEWWRSRDWVLVPDDLHQSASIVVADDAIFLPGNFRVLTEPTDSSGTACARVILTNEGS